MNHPQQGSAFPAGWYPDPQGHAQWRYWDGGAWLEHVRPYNQAVASGPPPPTVPATQAVVATSDQVPTHAPAGPPERTSKLGRMFGRRTETESLAENEHRALLDAAVEGRIDLRDLPTRLRGAADTAGLSPRKMAKLHAQAFRALAQRVLDDDILTAAEEAELLEVAEALGIPEDDLPTQFADVFDHLLIAQVNDGRLPVVVAPQLIAKAGETVHAEMPAALMKEVVHREYRGGSSGVSVPIGFGVRVRTGGFRGRSVVVGTSLEPADNGVLSITDRRVVYQGMKKTQESRYDRLVGLEVFSDGLRIGVSNRQNASLFRVPSGPVAAAVLNGALQRTLAA